MADGYIRWQCRRGMRELDELLVRYLENVFDRAPDSEKTTFRELLELPDPELIGYLLGSQVVEDRKLYDLVNKIKQLQSY